MKMPTKDQVWRIARIVLVWAAIYAFTVVVGALLPIPGVDWYHAFARHTVNYPPLILVLLAFLPSLPFLSGLTLTALLAALWRRKARPVHLIAAFTSMQLFWTLWLGQVDAVPALGLTMLPWGIPLVIMKPHVAVWYTWSWWRSRPDKWKIALATALLFAVMFLIWGWWPARVPASADASTVYNISLWRLWWPLGAAAMIAALLERDPDRAMALGALGVPYVQGANYLVLIPALTRLKGWSLLVVWLTTWASLLTLVLHDAARPLALAFPITLWFALWWQERRARSFRTEMQS